MARGKRRPRKPAGEEVNQGRSDAYGMNVGRQNIGERVAAWENVLRVFNNCCVGNAMAIPLPVATRGVGFSAALEYSRICAMWSLQEMSEICTIFQYYRVVLYLVYYKLYLARHEQYQLISSGYIENPIVIDEELRQILASIRQVPRSTYNIICAIGKIESSVIWYSVPFQGSPETGEEAALYLYPTNIRKTLTLLSDPKSDREYRQQFYIRNPLPGARWEEQANNGWVLLNADQIWPANYGADDLRRDLHSYCNARNCYAVRVPVGFTQNFTWNGKACKSGTVSLDLAPLCLRATFLPASPSTWRGNRRDALGRLITTQQQKAPVPEMAYQSDEIRGPDNVFIWSPDSDTSSSEMCAGAASLVGEHVGQPTRLQIQGRKQARVSSMGLLNMLINS